jgi:hypothetical protein
MTPDDDDIAKLRRFTLLVALALFIYAISGAELDLEGEFRPLGIPLQLKRANLIDNGLLIVSLYATLRYCLLALLLADSPIKARARIRHGRLATWRPLKGEVFRAASFLESFTEDVNKYYPPGRWVVSTSDEIDDKADGPPSLTWVNIPLPLRILGQVHNFDYYLPVLANIVALIANVFHQFDML